MTFWPINACAIKHRIEKKNLEKKGVALAVAFKDNRE
jgi:hypothetical protein